MSDAPPESAAVPVRRSYRYKLRWAIFWAIVLVAGIFILHESQTFSRCVHEVKNDEKYKALKESPGVLVEFIEIYWLRARLYVGCIGPFIDQNQGALTALATVALGIFTYALWRSTDRLWDASMLQARHAERAIGVSERSTQLQLRAYVHMEDISIVDENPKHAVIFSIKFRNIGNTPAYRVSSIIDTTVSIAGKPSFDPPQQRGLYYSLGPNQQHTTTVSFSIEIWRDIIRPVLVASAGSIYVFGEIRYYDAFQDQAVEEPRFTRFRSELILADDGIAKGSFVYSDEGNEAS
jgi:hypothetical protein